MFKLLDAFNARFHEADLGKMNDYAKYGQVYKRAKPSHMSVLALNQEGLKNMYKLVSLASTK